ncbi:MAG: hypothetical protein V1659_01840 [Candidatus Woesearchaeota archaeon]
MMVNMCELCDDFEFGGGTEENESGEFENQDFDSFSIDNYRTTLDLEDYEVEYLELMRVKRMLGRHWIKDYQN